MAQNSNQIYQDSLSFRVFKISLKSFFNLGIYLENLKWKFLQKEELYPDTVLDIGELISGYCF